MNKSIKTRVTLYVVCIVVVAVSLVAVFNVLFMGGRLMEDQRKQIDAETQRYANEIDIWIESELTLIEDVATAFEAVGNVDDSTVKLIIKNYSQKHEEILNLYIGTEDKYAYFGNPDIPVPEGYDPTTRGWYNSAKDAQKAIVTSPYKDFSSDNMIASFACPITINGEMIGVVASDVLLDTVVSLVDEINYDKGAYGFLIDGEKRFITHPNKDYLPTEDGSVEVEAVLPQIKALVEKPGSQVIRANNYDGTNVYYSTAVVEDAGWTIGIAVPTANVNGHMAKAITISIVIAILCEILNALIVVYIITKILSPIDLMVDAMSRLSEGDFQVKLDFSRKDDEIGKLQNSISNLVGILSAVIEEENYILGEIAMGNLQVEDMEDLPGQFDDLALSVNAITMTVNELIKDIQFSAMNIQASALGLEAATSPVEIQAVVQSLTVEANDLMEKMSRFQTK